VEKVALVLQKEVLETEVELLEIELGRVELHDRVESHLLDHREDNHFECNNRSNLFRTQEVLEVEQDVLHLVVLLSDLQR